MPDTFHPATCPDCRSSEVVRLPDGWAGGVIAIIGCGSPWHYATHTLADLPETSECVTVCAREGHPHASLPAEPFRIGVAARGGKQSALIAEIVERIRREAPSVVEITVHPAGEPRP